MHKPILGLIIVGLLIAGVLWYAPGTISEPPSPAASTSAPAEWETYSNDDLGITFLFPPEWGFVLADKEEEYIYFTFSKNQEMYGQTLAEDLGNLQERCPTPRTIENNGFCKLFTNDSDYLYEYIGEFGGAFVQRALVNLKSRTPSGFEIIQKLPAANLQSILDRSANPAILDKIDTFEQVMLSLEIK